MKGQIEQKVALGLTLGFTRLHGRVTVLNTDTDSTRWYFVPKRQVTQPTCRLQFTFLHVKNIPFQTSNTLITYLRKRVDLSVSIWSLLVAMRSFDSLMPTTYIIFHERDF